MIELCARHSLLLRLILAATTALAATALAQQVDVGSGSVVETVAKLHAGQFVWEPQVAPEGPMLLIVNTKTQRAVLFRNGVPIAASTISTGRPGRETPTGVFTVLQKEVVHHSSKYDNAPMPYMQRLTWQGVALHAGHLPGYPASHGCIRMPAGFAKLLYGVTSLGMTVVITNHSTAPRIAPTPQIVASGGAGVSGDPEGPVQWTPERSPSGPVSIVVSAADKRAVVLRNGVEIGSGPVTVEGPVGGTWAYALRNIDQSGQHWIRVQLARKSKERDPSVPRSEWQRFNAPESFKSAVAGVVAPGTTVVVTSDSLRSGAIAQPLTVMESAPRG
ncbi:MAG TPA: L,D-transpeptidase family protein [Sphingomicrobium sp.]|nr:L,D-transpeptidase family protein [Sphingomicrobium sp.]